MVFIAKDNVVRSYIKEASKYKSISKSEQLLMFKEYNETKDQRIKDKLINSNLMWVIKLAYKYCKNEHTYADLVNHGNMGLIEAFDEFDNTKNMSFTTFAVWYIEAGFKKFLQINSDIYIPEHANRVLQNISKLKASYVTKNKTVDVSTLISEYNKNTKNTKIDENTYSNILNLSNRLKSIDDNLSTDEDKMSTFGDTLPTISDTVKDMDKEHMQHGVLSILNSMLDEREATIIKYKFGFIDNEELELIQIAEKVGLTRERVGQIYTNAIKKLSKNKEIFAKLV